MRYLLYSLVVVFVGASWAATGHRGFEEPAHGGGEEAAVPGEQPPPPGPGDRSLVDDLLDRLRPRLLAVPGVIGVGHSLTEDGRDAVDVTVTDESVAAAIARDLEGVPVVVRIVPGGFRTYDA